MNRYTVHLFAHDGHAFAERLRTSAADVAEEVKAWAKKRHMPRQDLERGMKYVREVCSGDLGEFQREEHFDALYWIGDALMERVNLPEFSELGYSYIEQYGIVPGLLQHPPPYRLPRSKDIPPVAGYLPCTEMPSFRFENLSELQRQFRNALTKLGTVLTGEPQRTGLSEDDIKYGRQQFTDVLETLVEDKLDLLAVIV